VEFRKLIPAEFVWRDSRFTAAVRVKGELSHAHIANSGRLPGLLSPGCNIWLDDVGHPKRKTRFDLKLVEYKNILVSIDAKLPNPLFEEAVKSRLLKEYNYIDIQREVTLGRSRIDFLLSQPEEICWVETKSVTLVEDGIAKFPDAPTSRGRKHLIELRRSLGENIKASVIFVIQRPDAESFSPNWTIDPEFSKTLANVAIQGVQVHALLCQVSISSIEIFKEIPVLIE